MLGGLGVSLWVLRVGCGDGGRSRPSRLCSGRLVRGRRRRSRGGEFARGWLSLWRGQELGLEGVMGGGEDTYRRCGLRVRRRHRETLSRPLD